MERPRSPRCYNCGKRPVRKGSFFCTQKCATYMSPTMDEQAKIDDRGLHTLLCAAMNAKRPLGV